jgi:hypothetical protein
LDVRPVSAAPTLSWRRKRLHCILGAVVYSLVWRACAVRLVVIVLLWAGGCGKPWVVAAQQVGRAAPRPPELAISVQPVGLTGGAGDEGVCGGAVIPGCGPRVWCWEGRPGGPVMGVRPRVSLPSVTLEGRLGRGNRGPGMLYLVWGREDRTDGP